MVPVPQASREVLIPVWPKATTSAALNFPVAEGIAAVPPLGASHAAPMPITDLDKKSLRLMNAPLTEIDLLPIEPLELSEQEQPQPTRT
jgi:hypothetical protein